MKKFLFSLATLICICTSAFAQILVEAESFEYKGGWVADHQAFEKIRSSYLLAHGLGRPVADADTELAINTPGSYHIYVSTYNWTFPWYDGKGPGAFEVMVNGKSTGIELGIEGNCWGWQYAGTAEL